MIQVDDLSIGFQGRTLFTNVSIAFTAGHRYALTGPNGAGKSTFLRIIMGQQEPDSGRVHRPRQVGVLRQDHNAFDDQKVVNVVLMGNHTLWQALDEREKLYAKLDDMTEEEGMRLGELEMVIADEDGYTAEADAERLLIGLGIEADQHQMTMAEINPGLKVRVLLAQALFGSPDALLLDEPTNHLDIESIGWLEEFLYRYKGVLIVTSHDRHFLNRVATHIADIDYESIVIYPGNYDEMVVMKADMRHQAEGEERQRQARVNKLNEFIQRFQSGSRASQARSRQKMREKLTTKQILKRSNIRRPFIRFDPHRESGKIPLRANDIAKSFEGNQVVPSFHAEFGRGEKIAIIGRNGVGKTTLVRMLAGDLAPDKGDVVYGHEVRVGWFQQDAGEYIEAGDTVLSWLKGQVEDCEIEQIRDVMGKMLFKGSDSEKPTGGLSGGERVRLQMCRVMLQQPNVLFLDEPTNHLDIESIAALKEALKSYRGTLFFVTHDRDLVESVADRVLALDPGVLENFPGGFDDYLRWRESIRPIEV